MPQIFKNQTMNPIKAIIIDDEEGSRLTLQNLLKEYCAEIEILALADSAAAGRKAIQKHGPELVFLDVRMPAADEGFQLLESFDHINFAVIFTTSFDEYAIRAIKFSALDYLLKPINILELQRAVSRYSKRRGGNDARAIQNLTKKENDFAKIGLPSLEGLTFVSIVDIIRCEADGNCTVFYLKGKKKLLVTKTLKYYQELLAVHHFHRIHGSHLINLKHIKKYLREGTVELSENHAVFVSARKKKGFLERLQSLNFKL